MSRQKAPRKYIDSHWLIFAFQGIVGLTFGLFAVLTDIYDVYTLVVFAALTLVLFAIAEFINIAYRQIRGFSWSITIFIALIDMAVACALIFFRSDVYTTHIMIIAGYMILRGLFEIIMGLKVHTDKTDKFMWTVCGMLGIILGFVTLADQGISETTFIRVFGTYLMIVGLTNLIYSVHSKNALLEGSPSN